MLDGRQRENAIAYAAGTYHKAARLMYNHSVERIIIRVAIEDDLPPLVRLIKRYANENVLLPRNEAEIAARLDDFFVAVADGRVVGCGALEVYGPGTAEIRSLAVDPEGKGQGTGRLIVDALEEEARRRGLDMVFAFTLVPGFFGKLGFAEVTRDELPMKVWKDCLRCPKLHCCDEIAMQKPLWGEAHVARASSSRASRWPQAYSQISAS